MPTGISTDGGCKRSSVTLTQPTEPTATGPFMLYTKNGNGQVTNVNFHFGQTATTFDTADLDSTASATMYNRNDDMDADSAPLAPSYTLASLGENAWDIQFQISRSLRPHDFIDIIFPSELTVPSGSTTCYSLPYYDSTNEVYSLPNRVYGLKEGEKFTDRKGNSVQSGEDLLMYEIDCEFYGQFLVVYGLMSDLDLRKNTESDSTYSLVRILVGGTGSSSNPIANPYYKTDLGNFGIRTRRFNYMGGPCNTLEEKLDITPATKSITAKSDLFTGDSCEFKNKNTILKGLGDIMGTNKNTVPADMGMFTTFDITLDSAYPLKAGDYLEMTLRQEVCSYVGCDNNNYEYCVVESGSGSCSATASNKIRFTASSSTSGTVSFTIAAKIVATGCFSSVTQKTSSGADVITQTSGFTASDSKIVKAATSTSGLSTFGNLNTYSFSVDYSTGYNTRGYWEWGLSGSDLGKTEVVDTSDDASWIKACLYIGTGSS